MLPLANRTEILRRHEAVELLVRIDSTSEMGRIRSQLKELGGVPQICYTLNMGVGSAFMWAGLMKVGFCFTRLKDHGNVDKHVHCLRLTVLQTCNAIMNIRAELNSLDLASSQMLNEVSYTNVVRRPSTLHRRTDKILLRAPLFVAQGTGRRRLSSASVRLHGKHGEAVLDRLFRYQDPSKLTTPYHP